jgi:hypothetical protein
MCTGAAGGDAVQRVGAGGLAIQCLPLLSHELVAWALARTLLHVALLNSREPMCLLLAGFSKCRPPSSTARDCQQPASVGRRTSLDVLDCTHALVDHIPWQQSDRFLICT